MTHALEFAGAFLIWTVIVACVVSVLLVAVCVWLAYTDRRAERHPHRSRPVRPARHPLVGGRPVETAERAARAQLYSPPRLIAVSPQKAPAPLRTARRTDNKEKPLHVIE